MEFPFQMQQFPEELDWFVNQLLRADVKSILTIGVYTGGVEWWLANNYNKPLDITCVDIVEHPDFVKVRKLIAEIPHVKLSFICDDICNCEHLGMFDAVFIDGGHSHEQVKHDVTFAIQHASKLVAMHDIVDACEHTQEVAKAWKYWSEFFDHDSFAAHPEQDKGIGILYLGI